MMFRVVFWVILPWQYNPENNSEHFPLSTLVHTGAQELLKHL
jgi:hypothetical protein